MGLIYMRISPSGGKYIGKTIQTEAQRWRKHCVTAHSPENERYFDMINCAIRKYGDENFSVIILEDNISNEQLNNREIYWIAYYKTYYLDNNHGYNMTRGGDGSCKLIIDETELLKLWNQNKTVTELCEHFHCGRSSIELRIRQLTSPTERLAHRSTVRKGKVRKNNLDKINIAVDLWNKQKNIKEISDILHVTTNTVRNLLHAGGVNYKNFQRAKNKPILQYNKNGQLIKEWPSLKAAADELKLHVSGISAVLRGVNKTTGGYIFKYKEI